MSFGIDWIGLAPFHPMSACLVMHQTGRGGVFWFCQYCNRSFNSETGYDQHVRDSAAHKIWCTTCLLRFDGEVDWMEHMRVHHKGPYICCNRGFNTIERFCQHRRDAQRHAPSFHCNEHGDFSDHAEHRDCNQRGCELSYECTQCDTTCESLARVSQHMQRAHRPRTLMYNRRSSYSALRNAVRYGHYTVQSRLYRVQHPGSITWYADAAGFDSRIRWDPSGRREQFRQTLSKHCNWQAFRSPFISMFSDKQHALNWARQRRLPGTFIKIISADKLLDRGVRIWGVKDIDSTLSLQVKDSNWHSDEWVCLDQIPAWAIVGNLDYP